MVSIPVTSWYHWEDEIQKSKEVVLLCKPCVEAVVDHKAWLLVRHPYTCLCILVVPIRDGNTQFVHWIKKELQKD